MKNPRFWAVIAMLAGTVAVLYARGSADRIPGRERLEKFPETVGGWMGADLPIDEESLEVLGPGDFLSRSYTQSNVAEPINLFVAYFPTQRTGATIHSPKHCLPGSGWMFESSSYVRLTDVRGRTHRIGEYVITDGEARDFVIYWYEAHGRSVASEYMAKVYLVADAVRTNRTDGALVRVITPVGVMEDVSAARARAELFTKQIAPMLQRFIPD